MKTAKIDLFFTLTQYTSKVHDQEDDKKKKDHSEILSCLNYVGIARKNKAVLFLDISSSALHS